MNKQERQQEKLEDAIYRLIMCDSQAKFNRLAKSKYVLNQSFSDLCLTKEFDLNELINNPLLEKEARSSAILVQGTRDDINLRVPDFEVPDGVHAQNFFCYRKISRIGSCKIESLYISNVPEEISSGVSVKEIIFYDPSVSLAENKILLSQLRRKARASWNKSYMISLRKWNFEDDYDNESEEY